MSEDKKAIKERLKKKMYKQQEAKRREEEMIAAALSQVSVSKSNLTLYVGFGLGLILLGGGAYLILRG